VGKSLNSGEKRLLGRIFLSLLAGASLILAATDASVDALSKTLVERAQSEVARIEPLVADGTLPKTVLDEAKAKLADAEDQEILSETLYGDIKLENMTDAQATDMVAAAGRRVDRERELLQQREKLLVSGIIARSDLRSFQDELQSRERVLDLAKNRVQLLHELAQMAEAERRLEHDAQAMAASDLKKVMIRFGGNGLFSLSDLPTISTEFERHFHSALPVSARGQTLVHQAMGLDHRNRVDIALNPDSPEGVWLRQLLERLKIPYLAFRVAVAGAATAPHIHIGLESTRLRLASR
jgi:multidrug resistance efflux pump